MKITIDNYYDFNIHRTGLSKESDLYHKKSKNIKNIEDICLTNKIKFYFDCGFVKYDNEFSISATGCNYGIFVMIPSNSFYNYLFNVHIKNKLLKKQLNLDLKKELSISKYLDKNKHIFNKKIKGVAVLPNQNKIENLDFVKLNKFMEEDDNYIKIHPVISQTYINYLIYMYGKEKLIESKYEMFDVLMHCETVAITKNTEVMIPASLYKKNIYFLSNNIKTTSTYPLLYMLHENNIPIQKVFESEYLGLIPWSLTENFEYITHIIYKLKELHAEWRDSIYNCTVK